MDFFITLWHKTLKTYKAIWLSHLLWLFGTALLITISTFIVVATSEVSIVELFTTGFASSITEEEALAIIFRILLAAVVVQILAATYLLAIKLAIVFDNTSVKESFKVGLKRYLPTLLVSIVVIGLVIIGPILALQLEQARYFWLVVPGVILAIPLFFAPAFVTQGYSGLTSLHKSFSLVRFQYIPHILLFCLTILFITGSVSAQVAPINPFLSIIISFLLSPLGYAGYHTLFLHIREQRERLG